MPAVAGFRFDFRATENSRRICENYAAQISSSRASFSECERLREERRVTNDASLAFSVILIFNNVRETLRDGSRRKICTKYISRIKNNIRAFLGRDESVFSE